MNFLLIDNYDSFAWNLVHILRDMPEVEVTVRRNDRFTQAEVDAAEAIVLSPGPGLPADAGKMPELLKQIAGKKPVLGVCLGLQAIVEHYGGSLLNLEEVYHGRSSIVQRTDANDPILEGLPESFEVGRYHSWVADRREFPDSLQVSAQTSDSAIMALHHESEPVFGLQFHPESVLTPLGPQMLANFVAFARRFSASSPQSEKLTS